MNCRLRLSVCSSCAGLGRVLRRVLLRLLAVDRRLSFDRLTDLASTAAAATATARVAGYPPASTAPPPPSPPKWPVVPKTKSIELYDKTSINDIITAIVQKQFYFEITTHVKEFDWESCVQTEVQCTNHQLYQAPHLCSGLALV